MTGRGFEHTPVLTSMFCCIVLAGCWQSSMSTDQIRSDAETTAAADIDTDSDADSGADADTDTDSDSESPRDTYVDTDADTDVDADADTAPDTDADGDTGSDRDTERDSESDSQVSDKGGCVLEKKPMASSVLRGITHGEDGALYTYGSSSAVWYNGEIWQPVPRSSNDIIKIACVKPDGSLWVLSHGNALYTGLVDRLEHAFDLPTVDYLVPWVHALHCADNGSVYLAGAYQVIEWEGDGPPPQMSLLARYDGESLTQYALDRSERLYDLWSDEDVVIAVGESGTVLWLEGEGVSSIKSGVETDFHTVEAKSPDDLYAAGVGDLVYHFDGEAWTAFSLGQGESYWVHALAVTEFGVFAAGAERYYTEYSDIKYPSTVFALVDNGFVPLQDQPKAAIYDFAVVDEKIYAAGYREGAVVLSFDGDVWNEEHWQKHIGTLRYIAVNNEGGAAAVGYHSIATFDGATWSGIETDEQHFNDLVALPDGRFVAALSNYGSDQVAVVVIDMQGATPFEGFPFLDAQIFDLDLDDHGALWMAGQRRAETGEAMPVGESLVMKWDGDAFELCSPPDVAEAVFSISIAGDQVFAGINDRLFRFVEGEWAEIGLPAMDVFGPVFAASPDEVYIGRHPVYVYDGNVFTEVAFLSGTRAFGFALNNSGDLFVGGDELVDRDGDWSLLSARINGEWEALVRHNEALFFGSIATSGESVFALDQKYIWQGSCSEEPQAAK